MNSATAKRHSPHRREIMFKTDFLKSSKLKRTAFYAIVDGILLTIALYFAFYLRFEGSIPQIHIERFLGYLSVFLSIKYLLFMLFRLYNISWSYVGFYELLNTLKANVVAMVLLFGLSAFNYDGVFAGFPRSIPIIDFGISLLCIGMFRTSKRFYRQTWGSRHVKSMKHTLIIGAGNAGEQIVRDMRRQVNSPYTPVGFIDDDPMKQGVYIQGVKVYGGRGVIPDMVKKLEVQLVLLAVPSAASGEIRELLRLVRKSGVKEVKTLPGLNELVTGPVSLSDVKEIRIEEIIGREQVPIDREAVENFIEGKTLLITGAGGSIGSEVVRQVTAFRPKKIIALDIDETEVHKIELELGRHSEFELVPVVADIRDKHKLETVFSQHRPALVFHAAAYKHVPMMERYPEEAVKVNILGTKVVADAAIAHGTHKFILVSTDKAVRPKNIMGATKRVAEKIIRELNYRGKTKFISVRFGNVIGSRGSVVPIFEEQIKRGGPVTITHKDMKRYFMSIPEACILILQAAALGKGGEVFLLDMGEQIRIVDIARDLIRLNGLEPDKDIPIVFTGIRPGEKLYEELMTDTEGMEPTAHPKIFVARDSNGGNGHILDNVSMFEEVIKNRQWAWIRNLLMNCVPSYNPAVSEDDPLPARQFAGTGAGRTGDNPLFSVKITGGAEELEGIGLDIYKHNVRLWENFLMGRIYDKHGAN
ncbi:MAG: polysaccharide biosynthesis protein [Nitrospiraceae bacterium]|nr:MAG: polysaccharide biosynthesis protein [Nitrospiraceae bacterium]